MPLPHALLLALSTAKPHAAAATAPARVEMLPNARMDPLFHATVQATEEAIVNAMPAAETMTGADNHRVYALPADRLKEIMKRYGR